MTKPKTQSAKILTDAVAKTDQVQEDLKEAADSLGNANAVLTGSPSTGEAAIAGAIAQNLEAEDKVKEARVELENVKELIQDAQIAQAAGDSVRNSGEGTASILGYFEGRRAQADKDEQSRT